MRDLGRQEGARIFFDELIEPHRGPREAALERFAQGLHERCLIARAASGREKGGACVPVGSTRGGQKLHLRFAKPFSTWAATRFGSATIARERSAPVEGLCAATPCTAVSNAATASLCGDEWRKPKRSTVAGLKRNRGMSIWRAEGGSTRIRLCKDTSRAMKDIPYLQSRRAEG